MSLSHPISTLFPYTTLFRSRLRLFQRRLSAATLGSHDKACAVGKELSVAQVPWLTNHRHAFAPVAPPCGRFQWPFRIARSPHTPLPEYVAQRCSYLPTVDPLASQSQLPCHRFATIRWER